jgi:hypothetical protein
VFNSKSFVELILKTIASVGQGSYKTENGAALEMTDNTPRFFPA